MDDDMVKLDCNFDLQYKLYWPRRPIFEFEV